MVTAGCNPAGDIFCEEKGCQFSTVEYDRLRSLAGLSTPTPDLANLLTNPLDPRNTVAPDGLLSNAEKLGRLFYHDDRFSGVATQKDIARRLVSLPARAPIGERVNVSCSTCHDLSRGGADPTSVPGHVSVGAGWYDVNGQTTLNSAHYPLKYWNGRYESLVWQITGVAESFVSMNGTRVAFAWTIRDVPSYRDAYQQVFGPEPLFGRMQPTTAKLADDGQCELVAGACPVDGGCAVSGRYAGCWPRWPSTGRPGRDCKRVDRGGAMVCPPRGSFTPKDAFPDGCYEVDNRCLEAVAANFERLPEEDRRSFTRIFVNWAKAIAAFEYRLTTGTTPFDRWIAAGNPESGLISTAAKRGARLFVGKAACIDCHNTPLFSDGDFHNIGVPQRGVGVPTAADLDSKGRPFSDGWHRGLKLAQDTMTQSDVNRQFRNNDSIWSDVLPEQRALSRRQSDAKYAFEATDDLKGTWRTPSLRQVTESAPYMHNGFYRSLEDVVRHYNNGGTQEGAAPQHLSKRIRPLGLTEREILDLVAFMETLTAEKLLVEEAAAARGVPLDLKRPPDLP